MNGIKRHLGAGIAALICAAGMTPAMAQVAAEAERNVSKMANYQNECAIKVNPTNKNHVLALQQLDRRSLLRAQHRPRNHLDLSRRRQDHRRRRRGPGPPRLLRSEPRLGLVSETSTSPISATAARRDPAQHGRGPTFTSGTFAGSVDQPSVGGGRHHRPGGAGGRLGRLEQRHSMRARGAAVTGLGAVGVFGATRHPGYNGLQLRRHRHRASRVRGADLPDSDRRPGPLQHPRQHRRGRPRRRQFRPRRDGDHHQRRRLRLHPGAERCASVDSEAGLAYDRNATSPHFGRLYLVYTEETVAREQRHRHHACASRTTTARPGARRSGSTTIAHRPQPVPAEDRVRTRCRATSRSAGTTRAASAPQTTRCRSTARSRHRPARSRRSWRTQ